MKDKAISPHSNSNRVIAKCEAIGADEQAFGLREEPDGQNEEHIHKVAKIRQEIVEADLVVFVPSNGHEVAVERQSIFAELAHESKLTQVEQYTNSGSIADMRRSCTQR